MKTSIKTILIAISIFFSVSSAFAQVWSAAKANAWYKSKAWLVGANYIPAYAINQLEFWQEDTFNEKEIDKELALAESIGMNSMRVYLHHALWLQDKQGFKNRINTYLNIATKHHIITLFVLFDDCWNDTYKTGPQPQPKPGIHNSGWLKDPGNRIQNNPKLMDTLEAYTKDILKTFSKDKRILFWDLYNEPGQFDQHNKSLPLLENVFNWARQVKPSQPVTSGVYDDNEKAITNFQIRNSDVITYHSYDDAKTHQRRIDSLRTASGNRPLLCTEYIARKRQSTFENILPMLKNQKIAAYNWGLVDGKTQTKYAWDEPLKDGSEPKLWFHDIFKKDGTPYKKEETDLIKNLTKEK